MRVNLIWYKSTEYVRRHKSLGYSRRFLIWFLGNGPAISTATFSNLAPSLFCSLVMIPYWLHIKYVFCTNLRHHLHTLSYKSILEPSLIFCWHQDIHWNMRSSLKINSDKMKARCDVKAYFAVFKKYDLVWNSAFKNLGRVYILLSHELMWFAVFKRNRGQRRKWCTSG